MGGRDWTEVDGVERVCDFSEAIGADRLITLTYRASVRDMERVRRDFETFRHSYPKLSRSSFAPGLGRLKRGDFYLQVFAKGRQNFEELRSAWWGVVGVEGGGVHVLRVK